MVWKIENLREVEVKMLLLGLLGQKEGLLKHIVNVVYRTNLIA